MTIGSRILDIKFKVEKCL